MVSTDLIFTCITITWCVKEKKVFTQDLIFNILSYFNFLFFFFYDELRGEFVY